MRKLIITILVLCLFNFLVLAETSEVNTPVEDTQNAELKDSQEAVPANTDHSDRSGETDHQVDNDQNKETSTSSQEAPASSTSTTETEGSNDSTGSEGETKQPTETHSDTGSSPDEAEEFKKAFLEQFQLIDTDHDGYISKDEIIAFLGDQFEGSQEDHEALDAIFFGNDKDNDGKVSLQEFVDAGMAELQAMSESSDFNFDEDMGDQKNQGGDEL
mmetsp:Transcript_9494/g.10689  ORF Transcript_9494/g.10689 Transcript_9494/m.10689 type:complete len:216 (+) Transcript_9494:20-667(+)